MVIKYCSYLIKRHSKTKPGDNDPTLGEFKQNEVVNLGISPFGFQVPDEEITKYPKPGFQNAPAFCEDTDKALGTYSFNLPNDFATGEYTFVWLWAFNGAQVGNSNYQGYKDRSFRLSRPYK